MLIVRIPIPRAGFFSLEWDELEAYMCQEPRSVSGLFFSQKGNGLQTQVEISRSDIHYPWTSQTRKSLTTLELYR